MARIQYEWKAGSRASVEAQIAGTFLEKLRRKHGGLNAQLVVDESRPALAPLHDEFEWNDRAAAEEFRKEQARDILRAVVIVRQPQNGDPERFRAFVHVFGEEGDSLYTSLRIAMGDEVLRKQVLERAWRELETWRERYAEYAELASVFNAIDQKRKAS